MAKTEEAEPVELDVAASVARSMAGKAGSNPPEASAFPQNVDMVLEARLTAQFSALEALEDEQQLVSAFLVASRASQRLLTLKLLANPAIERFPELLQFFLRVMMAVHARSHAQQTDTEPSTCSYAQNTAQSCISFEQEENSGSSVAFQLPEGFHSCLSTHFGSVKRLKCEEVWHGDHMAYRCRTCGLSDSSCMCLACFDPEEHEGHDYRVYRCSSGGCCDCGDPLAWKPEGFCKKHSAKKENEAREDMQNKMKMDPEENEVVQMLVRRTMDFCVDVLREVHLSCLRPHASENPDPFHPRRSLPRTGLQRSAFPSVVKVHVDRLQQTLAWLQMLSMSCLYYRNMISDMFFEELPADFQLTTESTQNTTGSDSSRQPVEDNPVETAPTSGESEEEVELEEEALNHGPLLMLDVFLKAGVLLPVEACDVLGVLYLKLLFDQAFKQKYTCHFVEWYPYFIELYLSASDENNEDGMRNLSRFIDRLFCQLFHSNAQLRELETVFASLRPTFNPNESHGTRRRRRRRPHGTPGSSTVATDSTSSSCVEWLMVFLLEKLNGLFRSTLRLMTILPQPLLDGTRIGASANGSSTSTVGIGTVPEAPPVLRTVQAVDCGRSVFKKRIYARLCSDLRTLLVHPQIAAEVLLRSFRCIGGDECELHGSSVYAQLMKTFELLQQMDLQTRHVHRHIEYESQNWTFAFVADYELKLLLSAFLTGIPACFSREVWGNITTGENSWNQGATGVITGSTPLNPLETDTFRHLALARALLQPVRASLGQWTTRNGRPELVSKTTEVTSAGPGEGAMESVEMINTQLVKYYEQGTVALGGASAKSFHFPLHHMYAALIHALCGVVRPQTMDDWRELLGMGTTNEVKGKDLSFWYGVLDHPLRVLLFSREIKAGLWVRNGGVMLQQLIHYHSKHWRYFGLHSDLFLCQLGASLLPHGSFIRLFFHQLPFGIRDSTVLGISSLDVEIDDTTIVADGDRSRELRQELDIVEEALRLLLQLVLAPVKLASASSPETAAVWLLEREIMHWLTLGPFTRSEVILRTDMKLVEQIKQLPTHEWAELEEEEILTHVLENVGVYDDPVGTNSGPRTARSGSFVGCGLKMSGSWKLKPELWSRVSPLFECFTPSEAQQCEQNIRKNLRKPNNGEDTASTSPIILPMLPRPQLEGSSGVDMHGLLVDTMLNSSYMASVLFVIFENYKRKISTQHRAQPTVSEEQDSANSSTNENLLLAALHCLYVAVEMLPKDIQDLQPQAQRSCTGTGSYQNLDDIGQCFDEASTLFVKLRTQVPVEAQAHGSKGHEMTGSSLLSLLLFFTDHKSAMEDSQPVVELILRSVCEKSSACSQYMDAIKRKQLESSSNVENCFNPASCSKDDSDGNENDQPKPSAKEMMQRRQQQILEKMRSQQMQFLSANGDDMEDDAVGNSRNDVEGQDVAESDSDSYAESMESEEGLDHEEDEWGFPTGQVDVRLYLDHVSSAIAQIREKQRKSQDRRRRRRRSTRSSSITAENDERGRSPSISCDFGSLDETEECGLCRLPCDPRSRESSFGFVGMILPTNMPQKLEKCSLSGANSDARPVVSSRLPSLRVLKPGTTNEMRMQLADSVIWSCGHAIHHACLKAYLMSLWKQKHGRSPLEMASGEDRLLSERDMEFVCPICRRLSNCLVPRVSLGEFRERSSTSEFMKSGFGSDEEEEEKKDDGQDPLVFLQWLDTHMSFRDDSPVVKRRRSRTQSSLRLRRRLLSSASKASLSPGSLSSAGSPSSPGEQDSTEQDVSVEREIGAFCHEIVLRAVRAQLYLPTLLTSSIRDEGSLDLEMQQLSSECGAQTPAWQLLLHCLEVQLRVVAREKTLLQTDAVDPLQLRSMRQLAEITAAAVAFSTPSSLAWTVVEAPADKQFESVMTKLNGLIFGQQVLFEEDEENSNKWSMPMSDIDDATDAALVGTPMLCHPRLLTCFAMRLMWRQSVATPNSDVAVEQLLTEAFFSARVLFTAQILQAVAYLSMQDQQDKVESEEEPFDKTEVEIRDFEHVESLRDASAWISLMLARSRLADTKAFAVSNAKPARKWNAVAMEEQVSALCLPLAQQMLLLMDVVLQLPHHHSENQGDDSNTPQAASESCAVCDGLFPATSPSTGPPTASALLEKCLRRLHLPPLRLFFHRQMFPSSQRALCQLWGAQLEAKAAVSRQQARSLALVAGSSPRQVDTFPLQRQVKLLSARAAAIASAGADFRLLIELPRVYMDLFIRYNEKPMGVCGQCAQVPQHPGLCLFCGEVLCCFSACCEAKEGGGVGECTQHAQRCGLGIGAFLLLRACTVILFLGNERRCVWGSLYVDKNGEEDPYLRRGKTLYLDESRRLALETLLVSHSFSQNTAILQNTSRRDGRRY
ncbi:E3 ubiquitin-protein ligase ubr3 [Phytophthora citrophthora]|uniref:E3 ubiquitin-protein ligase n=1 Tax=Phytophthora citrophthora TaxID=4793 RepID=A0AAD9LF83_9STRA|nr:E3 ubiquitin-protein ligase ubr3 [Phytophthora citrophthora]